MSFRIEQFEPYVLGEIASAIVAARGSGKDVIDLSQINPILGPHPAAMEALVQATLRPTNHRYSSSQGITRLRQAVSHWAAREFNTELCADSEVIITLGTKDGVAHLLLALASAGETVIIPTPSYPVHRAACFIAGLNVAELALDAEAPGSTKCLTAESDFLPRLRKLLAESKQRPKYLLLSLPHNPTGTSADISFFTELVNLAKEENLFIIHDFAYWGISFDGYVPPSVLSAAGAKEVAVEFCSFSKSFSAPGWRIGMCGGNDRMISALKKIKSYTDYGVFQPLQIAAIQLLNKSEEILSETSSIYQSRRDIIVEGLKRLKFELDFPKSGLSVWAKLPPEIRAQGGLKFSKGLLDEALVAICPGEGFDRSAESYVRLSLAADERQLRNALVRIERYLLP